MIYEQVPECTKNLAGILFNNSISLKGILAYIHDTKNNKINVGVFKCALESFLQKIL